MFPLATQVLLDENSNLESKGYLEALKRRRAELEHELHALGVRQNGCSLPNRLPTEILERIFMEHVQNVCGDDQEEFKLRWARISQVCRHWREVSLNYAPLWKAVSLSHPEFMELILERSKGVNLSFDFDSSQLNYYRTMHKVWTACEFITGMLSEIERFRGLRLRMSCESGTSLGDLLYGASGRAPSLTDLSLSVSTGSQPVPPDFLEGGLGAPALQHLHLERTFIPWSKIPLPTTLTNLTLHEVAPRPPGGPFYQSIVSLAVLEKLALVNGVPEFNNSFAISQSSPPFVLSSLKSLIVEDLTSELLHFFSCVRTPNVTYLKMTFRDRLPSGPLVDQCLSRARRAIGNYLERSFMMNTLILRHFDGVTLHPYKPSILMLYKPPPLPEGHGSPTIFIEFTYQHLPIANILASVVTNFQIATVEVLEVIQCGGIPSRLLLETFSWLSNVLRIQLLSTPVYMFFGEMRRDPALHQQEEVPDGPQPYFSGLEVIDLNCVDFEEGGTVEREDMVECISRFMTQRALSHLVWELNITNCMNFGGAELNDLWGGTPCAVDLRWDGGSEPESEDHRPEPPHPAA